MNDLQANLLTLDQIGTALGDLGDFKVIRTIEGAASPWVATVSNADIAGDGALRGLSDSGASPEEAIRNLWGLATSVPLDRHIKCGRPGRRRLLRWSGFMWRDVTQEVNHAG